jgi:NADPH:quinone reductase-like Zn-dependent oxidoreductase
MLTPGNGRKETAVNVTEMVMTRKGDPTVLQKRESKLPALAANEAMIQIEATEVSYVELRMLRGRFPGQPKFPFVPGYDIVGIVVAVGTAVSTITVGQRVAAVTNIGGWASHITLPERELVPVPDGIDAAEAVAVVVNGITAWQLLHRHAQVSAGQTVLVQGATGGVGSLLVQFAILAGARVIGTASTSKQEAVRALGAIPIDYRKENIVERVRQIAPEGIQAVFDHVGDLKGLRDSFHLLNRGGVLLSYGVTASTHSDKGSPLMPYLTINGQYLIWNMLPNGRRTVFYYILTDKQRKPEAFRSDLAQVFALLTQKQIKVQVGHRLPLEKASEALRLLGAGSFTGKIVLLPEL